MRMGNNFASSTIAFGVLIMLIFLNGFGILSPILDYGRVSVNFLEVPLVSSLKWGRDWSKAFFEIHDLVKQNDLLSKQIEALNTELARRERALEENRILREALGFQGSTKYELVPGEVLNYDFLNINERVILNRGERDGVKAGDNVIVSGGTLVGIVSEVSQQTSFLELITSSGQAANARTANGKATGIVRGEHGLGLVFDQVSLSETLSADDRVVTSGLGGKFLPDLYIGKIGEVKIRSTDLFQVATVIPAVSYRNLQFVFIIKNP